MSSSQTKSYQMMQAMSAGKFLMGSFGRATQNPMAANSNIALRSALARAADMDMAANSNRVPALRAA